MKVFKREPRVQGQDSIIINAPVSKLWHLIHDSKQMESWGPPVEKVEIELLPDQDRENIGSKRKVYAKFTEKRRGWYEEVRTGQDEGLSITFRIVDDSFGMGKMLEDVGGKMELEHVATDKTKFIFTFYHRPKNLIGHLMNPLIKKDQKANRLKALQSFKSYVETGVALKN